MKKQSYYSILVLLAVVLATAPLMGAEEQTMSSGSITFVSGGVGEDSAERMATLSKDFNLNLLFATKDGHYLADVAVIISDARGVKVIEAVSEGPFLLAKLAPGKYQVKATYAGESFTQQTTIPAGARRELVFRWVEEEAQVTDRHCKMNCG
jgi:hypothetical protein